MIKKYHAARNSTLLKIQPVIFEVQYLSENGLTANLAKMKGPLTLWDLQLLRSNLLLFNCSLNSLS